MAKRLGTLRALKEAMGLAWEAIAREAGVSLSILVGERHLLSLESAVRLSRALARILGKRVDEVIPPLSPEEERAARILYALSVEQEAQRRVGSWKRWKA